MKRTPLLFILFAGLMCVAESNVRAAVFIKIGDIKGESTDKAHLEWSELLSMDFSMVREPEGGSTRLRPAVARAFNCVKEVDKASPKLMEAIAMGTVIPTLTIHFTRTTGEGRETYLRYELKNVLITSYGTSGSAAGDQPPVESMSLNYEEIKVIYDEIGNDGAPVGSVDYTWDLTTNEGA